MNKVETKKCKKAANTEPSKPLKFRGGRFRAGDNAVRIIEEDGKKWKTVCLVIRINRKHIVCEIALASAGKACNVIKEICFDRKTGIHERGNEFGYLQNPKKKKISASEGAVDLILALSKGKNETPYNYCN